MRNFLCAGFSPSQIMLVTSGELYKDQMGALTRISEFVGEPLAFRDAESEHEVRKGIYKNSKSKGEIGDATKQLLYVFGHYSLATQG